MAALSATCQCLDQSAARQLVLATRRHVLELADLNDAESATLGAWQVQLARALGEELGTSKTYVAEFGEVPSYHLHFHVIPRLHDLDPAMLGPGVFGHLGVSDDEQVSAKVRDDFARKLTTRLLA